VGGFHGDGKGKDITWPPDQAPQPTCQGCWVMGGRFIAATSFMFGTLRVTWGLAILTRRANKTLRRPPAKRELKLNFPCSLNTGPTLQLRKTLWTSPEQGSEFQRYGVYRVVTVTLFRPASQRSPKQNIASIHQTISHPWQITL